MGRKDYFQKEVGLASQPISFPLTIDFVKILLEERGSGQALQFWGTELLLPVEEG